jgi:transcriptional regulator NrdR family protein
MDCMECEGRSRVLETERVSRGVKRVRRCQLCGVRWTTFERLHEMFHVKPKEVGKLTESVSKPVVVQVIPSNESVGYGRSLLDNDDYDFEY